MHIELERLIAPNQTVAVAVSGGSDSVALLYYTLNAAEKYRFRVKALNVEHGIRGKDSERDSFFVKNLCEKWSIELIEYKVDSRKKAREEKLSLEHAARALRYQCFYDAINKGLCDKIATAHHKRDNAETVLFNLFRGTGLSGVTGITQNFENKIIRPFLSVEKEKIEEYIQENGLPFVTDQTNFDDEYTRNYIRLNILPEIKKIFPEVENSISRFAEIAKNENDYMEIQALSALKTDNGTVKIALPLHPALIARATVKALKSLGVEKDWEKAHVDSVINLANAKNGARVNLKCGITVAKEYDALTFYKEESAVFDDMPFSVGSFVIGNNNVRIEKIYKPENLKDGFYADLGKIPKTAVIRYKRDGDLFTKFGGGTKPLGEYFADVKIPLRKRNFIPVIADGKTVLAIIGVAISEKIKVDENTLNIIKIN